MKFFQKMNMQSETIKSAMRTGLMQDGSGNDIAVESGAFVKVVGLADNEVYSQYVPGIKDLNKFIVTAPAAGDVTATNANIYVIDPVKVSDGTIAGNIYREGSKTLGLGANAGEAVAMRKLFQDDYFVLGADNFKTAPTVGKFAILTATETVLTNADAIPNTGLTVVIESEFNVSQGIDATKGYICRVVQL